MRIPKRVLIVELAISNASEVSIEEIRGKSREKAIVDARHAIWFICYEHFRYSYGDIGRWYGRDHTSVMHGVKRLRKSEHVTKVLEGMEAKYPGLIRKITGERGGRTIENWHFGSGGERQFFISSGMPQETVEKVLREVGYWNVDSK